MALVGSIRNYIAITLTSARITLAVYGDVLNSPLPSIVVPSPRKPNTKPLPHYARAVAIANSFTAELYVGGASRVDGEKTPHVPTLNSCLLSVSLAMHEKVSYGFWGSTNEVIVESRSV